MLDAVIEFVEHCEWSDAIDVRPVIAELGLKPGKVMHVLYTAIEGASVGSAALRLDRVARAANAALRRLRAARARLAGA